MNTLTLTGLDGSNPLAFLAALGTLRTLSEAWPTREIQMMWQIRAGAWRPVLCALDLGDADTIVKAISHHLRLGQEDRRQDSHLDVGTNLSVSPEDFRTHVLCAAASSMPRARRIVDFFASFGSEVLVHDKLDRIACTELCFLFGSGHQNYLDTMTKLLQRLSEKNIQDALFAPWSYRDERLSMRWDPADARQHAYLWTSPGDETPMTVWGANLLAGEGSSLFPVVPTTSVCPTVGFTRRRSAYFTWPVWHPGISLDTLRSLLAMEFLQHEQVDRAIADAYGIAEVFRSRKIKIGEGANFKWSFSPACGV